MQELQGRILNRNYKLLRLIGEGGMGSVWEAELRGDGSRLAVKVMHEMEGDHKGLLKRFFREAQAAAAIGHPNIVQIFEVGVEKDGTAFMVMELLRGISLAELLRERGSLPPERVITIVLQVLSALHAAHKKGIVHRDLKPDNVFLSLNNRGKEDIKLLDFGIAKVLAAGSESIKLTKPGTVLGTPHYLSPEQAAGRKDIDARIDVWAIGVLMYEMLSGQMPFDGENYNEIIGKILMNEARPLQMVIPGVSPELASIVARSMEKNREKRYAQVSDLIKDLMPLNDNFYEEMGTDVAKAVHESIMPPPLEPIDNGSAESRRDKGQVNSYTPTIAIVNSIVTPREKRVLWFRRALAMAVILSMTLYVSWKLFLGKESRSAEQIALRHVPADLRSATKVETRPPSGGHPVPTTGRVAETDRKKERDFNTNRVQPEATSSDMSAKIAKIELLNLPERAKVFWGGKRVFPPLEVPVSSTPTTLQVICPGYRKFTKALTPSQNIKIEIKMKTVRSSGSSKKTRKNDPAIQGWKDNPFAK